MSMRKSIFWLGLICLTIGAHAHAQTAQPSPYSVPMGIVFESIPGNMTTVGVVNTNNAGPQWFLLRGDGNQHIGSISPGFNIVDDMKASENGQYLAVLSVGEGHPVVDVIDVNALLGKKAFQVLQHVDPYPGIVSLDGWNGANLIIKSDMLLTERDMKTGRMSSDMRLSADETFALNIASGQVSAVSDGAKNPAEHYAKILLDENAGDAAKNAALNKLMTMHSKELTLQYLLKVLDQEKNPERINRLLDLINKLRE